MNIFIAEFGFSNLIFGNYFIQIIFAVIMVIACASAKPSVFAPAALAYTSPLIAAAPLPYVAASSSQVVARNYNGVAVAAPFFAAPAPLIASAAAPALVSPYAAYPRLAASPFAYSGLPLGYSGLPLGYSAY